jgi:hypothetical protein
MQYVAVCSRHPAKRWGLDKNLKKTAGITFVRSLLLRNAREFLNYDNTCYVVDRLKGNGCRWWAAAAVGVREDGAAGRFLVGLGIWDAVYLFITVLSRF